MPNHASHLTAALRTRHPWILLIACISFTLYLIQACPMFFSWYADVLMIAVLISFLIMPKYPRQGIGAALCLLMASAYLPFPTPSASSALMVLLIATLGAIGTYDVLIAAPLALIAIICNPYRADYVRPLDGWQLAGAAMLVLGAAAVGMLLRQIQLRRQADKQHVEDMERLRVARLLHDSVANGITRALLLIDSDVTDDAQLHGELTQALTDTHSIISTLEDGEDRISAPASDDIATSVEHMEHQLAQAGFDGELLANTASLRLSCAAEELLRNILKETTTNMLKHPNPEYPYIISLYSANGNAAFRITDTPKNTTPEPSHQYGRSSGLARHQQQIERIGGTVTISYDRNLFSATYTLPTRPPR
ncbi:hypothetical protein CGZ88_1171 [Bifidobacterium anseris]|uniref:Histidine kinase n=1 Tax=Bifidobacterium anseris TaxID=2020963 RepID=A0A2N5IXL2_9BIFI|nr:hypothetical protein [Bifidobacterium anseris]PLS26686.1 hypothetical protein CGZ88_1171 [Bifidobacterium anseris]